ncbi:MAG TPA: hypothetical protein DHV48_14230 [Prolixibacteraceae bacterium]|nr:hypothetical protein [Prolixibacteraceae bacterium]
MKQSNGFSRQKKVIKHSLATLINWQRKIKIGFHHFSSFFFIIWPGNFSEPKIQSYENNGFNRNPED